MFDVRFVHQKESVKMKSIETNCYLQISIEHIDSVLLVLFDDDECQMAVSNWLTMTMFVEVQLELVFDNMHIDRDYATIHWYIH